MALLYGTHHCLWRRDIGCQSIYLSCSKVICHISWYFLFFQKYIFSLSLVSLWYFSCQSQAAAMYITPCSFSLSLTGWMASACEKALLLYLRKPSTRPGPVIQCVCRFAACKVLFCFVFLAAFWQLFACHFSSLYLLQSSFTCSQLSTSYFTRFLRQMHHSKYFQLICRECPLTVSLKASLNVDVILSLSYFLCTGT